MGRATVVALVMLSGLLLVAAIVVARLGLNTEASPFLQATATPYRAFLPLVFKDPTLTPTSTATPTATPTPTPTPTPTYPFKGYVVWVDPNCGLNMIKGHVLDAANNYLNGYRVRVRTYAGWEATSWPSGDAGYGMGDGYYDFALAVPAYTFDMNWLVWLIDDADSQISDRQDVKTDGASTPGCAPGGSQIQVITINFKRTS